MIGGTGGNTEVDKFVRAQKFLARCSVFNIGGVSDKENSREDKVRSLAKNYPDEGEFPCSAESSEFIGPS